MFNLWIDGETPSKKNANKFSRSTGIVYKTKAFRDWHARAMAQIKKELTAMSFNKALTAGQVEKVGLTFYHADRSRRDSDNQATSILDLLVDCKVIEDDCWSIIPIIIIKNEMKKDGAMCAINFITKRAEI